MTQHVSESAPRPIDSTSKPKNWDSALFDGGTRVHAFKGDQLLRYDWNDRHVVDVQALKDAYPGIPKYWQR